MAKDYWLDRDEISGSWLVTLTKEREAASRDYRYKEASLAGCSEGGIDMRKAVACYIFLLCMASITMLGQQVSVNYNHNANFAQYHTYAWGSDNKNAIQNSILAQVAQQDIESAMASKGLQKVPESQNPDLILTASGGEREQTSYNAWGMRGIGGGMGGITPEQNYETTMVVSLYDTKGKELVWRGIAQNTLSNNGNKNQKNVEKAVEKMFKQWPK